MNQFINSLQYDRSNRCIKNHENINKINIGAYKEYLVNTEVFYTYDVLVRVGDENKVLVTEVMTPNEFGYFSALLELTPEVDRIVISTLERSMHTGCILMSYLMIMKDEDMEVLQDREYDVLEIDEERVSYLDLLLE